MHNSPRAVGKRISRPNSDDALLSVARSHMSDSCSHGRGSSRRRRLCVENGPRTVRALCGHCAGCRKSFPDKACAHCIGGPPRLTAGSRHPPRRCRHWLREGECTPTPSSGRPASRSRRLPRAFRQPFLTIAANLASSLSTAWASRAPLRPCFLRATRLMSKRVMALWLRPTCSAVYAVVSPSMNHFLARVIPVSVSFARATIAALEAK